MKYPRTKNCEMLLEHGDRHSTFRKQKDWLAVSDSLTSSISLQHTELLTLMLFNLNSVYSCSYDKALINQGWMYISENYLCFYSFILGKETKLFLELKDIVELKKDRSKKGMVSDAIRIKIRDGHEVSISKTAANS